MVVPVLLPGRGGIDWLALSCKVVISAWDGPFIYFHKNTQALPVSYTGSRILCGWRGFVFFCVGMCFQYQCQCMREKENMECRSAFFLEVQGETNMFRAKAH